MRHLGHGSYRQWGLGAMGYLGTWAMAMRVIGQTGTGPLDPGVWGTWPIAPCTPCTLLPHVPYGVNGLQGLMGHGPTGLPMGPPWAIRPFLPHSIITTGWILIKILLDIDINVFYLNTGPFFLDGFI